MKRMLAAPFVMTLSVGGCARNDGGEKPPPPLPAPAPTTQAPIPPAPIATAPIAPAPTTQSRTPAPGDPAGALVYDGFGSCYREVDGKKQYANCPDALLPVAASDRLVFKYGGQCKTAPDGKRVRCPDGGATATLPAQTSIDKGGQWTSLQIGTLHCLQGVKMKCPPRAFCNPPPPHAVQCPPELLPKLRDGVAPTRRDGARALYADVEVACDGTAKSGAP